MRKKIVGIAAVIMMVTVYIGAVVGSGIPADMGRRGTLSDHNSIVFISSVPQKEDLDAAFENNETIWAPPGIQMVEEQSLSSLDLRSTLGNIHYSDYYRFSIRDGNQIWLLTPFVTSCSKNGITPRVRYLWYTIDMPVGVNVTQTIVTSNGQYIYNNFIVKQGTGDRKAYVVDLGSRRLIPGPVQLVLSVDNDQATNQTVQSYGARLLEEW